MSDSLPHPVKDTWAEILYTHAWEEQPDPIQCSSADVAVLKGHAASCGGGTVTETSSS